MNYSRPFDREDPQYPAEPTDSQATTLARALAHWTNIYEETDAAAIVADILESNAASTDPMTRDECLRIAAVFGLAI